MTPAEYCIKEHVKHRDMIQVGQADPNTVEGPILHEASLISLPAVRKADHPEKKISGVSTSNRFGILSVESEEDLEESIADEQDAAQCKHPALKRVISNKKSKNYSKLNMKKAKPIKEELDVVTLSLATCKQVKEEKCENCFKTHFPYPKLMGKI